MELWYTEKQTENHGITSKITRTLHTEKTEFQDLAVLETIQFGRMLTLDGLVMTTIEDEFVYHEMITHVPLNTHANPERVLVIGGGDGGTIREVVKHPQVKQVVLVEIDRRVVEVSREYLPEISCALDNPKVTVLYEDGIKYVREHKNEFDIIVIDSTDPIGPAVGLFSLEFYRHAAEALKDDGIMVAQTESPFFNKELITQVNRDIGSVFPITKLYLAHIPTYPSGTWSFTMGSKKYDPETADLSHWPGYATRYYTPELHRSAFKLPQFVGELVK